MVKIAVLGYGTVGSGVVEVLRTNQKVIDERLGEELRIKYVLDLRDFPDDPVQEFITHDFEEIVSDEEVKIVVEVMGGIEPAYTFVKRSLEAGKSVATSNKALVAKHGADLLKIAKDKNVNFLFEASVGGGIPILRPLHSSLTGDVIEEITGILNGTTNYMMTKMFYEGADYDEVLKEAQDNGFAERNPEADVEGYDACRKIAILSSLAYGRNVDFQDIHTEGITKISSADIKYANAWGASIKLLATSRVVDGKVYAMVSPIMLDANDPLYSVNGVFNAIFVHGDMLGDAMFYGQGAGKLPTATAVVGDVVEAVRHPHDGDMMGWSSEKLELADYKELKFRFFVRMKGSFTESLDKVEAVFGNIDAKVLAQVSGEFGFITEKMTEAQYLEKAARFDNILGMIRVRF